MPVMDPTANYTSPDKSAQINIGDGPHTTNGRTTQISDIVINAGGEDRDKPSEASSTYLGQLRSKVTSLQDNINEFLTKRMAENKSSGNDNDATNDIEARVLDGDDSEDN